MAGTITLDIAQLANRVRASVLDTANDTQVPEAAAREGIEAIFDEMLLAGQPTSQENELREQLTASLLGYGALEPYLTDEGIEEIWLNRPDEVIFVRSGVRHQEQLNLDAASLRTVILRLLRNTGRRIDSSLPFADAVLPDGSRLHVVIPDVTAAHWSVNIRKFPQSILTMDSLAKMGTLTPQQQKFLTDAARAGANILISGATHSGKTTLLGALLSALDHQTRLVSCEETFELRTTLTDWVAMQARQPNLEGAGEIPLRRLVKESLRMRPDRIVIGEVREAEALDLLIAMNSGVSGACTIHANSAAAAITKLCTLPLLAGSNISSEFVLKTVSESVHYVVHCEHIGGGVRRVAEIAEVVADQSGWPVARAVNLK